MNICDIKTQLQQMGNPDNVAGMARYGINVEHAFGVPMPALRRMAKEIGRNHPLAQELWATGIHEARILAGLIAEPNQLTESQMEEWAQDFDSWDVCDQVCNNLFSKSSLAYNKALEWSYREETFVKRAGFVLMASLAVHDEKAPNQAFKEFLFRIVETATDDRNIVKKAVNWALRQIGKRNSALNHTAIETASRIRKMDSPTARWIASDAIRELSGEKVQMRLKKTSVNLPAGRKRKLPEND